MPDTILKELEQKMDKTLDALHKELGGLRTGRASTSLLEPIIVEAYGGSMPITQVGTINAPEARLLTVQVWDKSMVNAVEKSIREANLGLNPVADGQTVRVPMPELSQERRTELVKIARKYGEEAKISIRNIRRDGTDKLKAMEKAGEISEDEHHRLTDKVQTIIESYNKKVDEQLTSKEADIMKV